MQQEQEEKTMPEDGAVKEPELEPEEKGKEAETGMPEERPSQ
jgi:hypothetical protein